MSLTPKTPIPEGAIRYNTDSNKMEVWIGDKWMIVSTSSPNLDGGVRGLFAAGATNVIDFVTIASAGNATDFGDMTVAYRNRDSCQSPTRGILAGGYNSPGDDTNVIEFVVTATTGNATDFGDTTAGRDGWGQNGYGNATRGVFPLSSGAGPNYVHDSLNYITLSSLGNTTEYGDLTTNRNLACSFSNPTRGILVAGASPDSDDIDYNNIATGGTSVDFGEYSAYSKLSAASGCSNAHGGL